MTLITAITVGVLFAAASYLLLSRELKATAMGVFLLGHGANLAILGVSRSPIGRRPPVLGESGSLLGTEADPLPQALILTAIVIGFAVQAFLLTLIVVTWRRAGTLELPELAATPPTGTREPYPARGRETVDDRLPPDATPAATQETAAP